MHSFILQDWITIRGTAISGGQTITQSESAWLDLAPYQDINLWLDVREVSGSTAPNIIFQTAPIKDEVLFQAMIAAIPLSLSPSNPYRVLLASATVPVARYVRWQLQETANTAWDVTFRVLCAANALGL